ncbi:MAG TPA: type II toxin-antitoxin system VapC family toxin [Solirubrobacteraceae bacterium]|nr:type II toxin-antitoxin system VapC family toxin [Solirubrobacteraceae bacterium]
MRLLVDAHALIWWLADDRRLSPAARGAIESSEDARVGAGTLIEIAVKRSLGKLDTDEGWTEQVQADGFGVLSVSWAHIGRLQRLPYPQMPAGATHRDPFDRLLAAQALSDSTAVVTRDPTFAEYGVRVIW